MQISSAHAFHLDDAAIASLLDPASVTEAVADAFGAWGRGEAATTQRVRSSASGMIASAMAAVVAPYSGGRLYATTNGAFTFVNVLFETQGVALQDVAVSALAYRRHLETRTDREESS